MDVFFKLIVVLEHESSQHQLVHMFQIKISTFIRLMHGFMDKIYEFCVKRFGEKYDERFMIHSMIEENHLFKYFPFCLEAVNVTFQQYNCPSGNMQ